MLVNPLSPDTLVEIRSVQSVAQSLGFQLAMFNAATPAEIDAAFDGIVEKRPDALLVAMLVP